MQPFPKPRTAGYRSLYTLLLLLLTLPAMAQFNTPDPFEGTLAAAVLPGGTTAYEPATGTHTLSGTDRYRWKSVQGDFVLRAEVTLLTEAGEAGWSVRDRLGPDANSIDGAVDAGGTVRLADGNVEEPASAGSGSFTVLELERRGDTIYLRAAPLGEPLAVVGKRTAELRNEAFVGLYVRGTNGAATVATFRNVRIVKPAPAELTPYEDYLGSRLEVLDLETGIRKVLLSSAHSLQAPNWTTDGRYLVYNSNGFIYRYDLETGGVTRLDTGPATDNNNDHVLSFDGSLLGISSYVAGEERASTIYVLPADGSDKPQRVTRPNVGHSYLHGISPDNERVVFTGNRNGKYDIYTAEIATGEETQLTDTPGLDDGPEYSPDGRYVYFNSTRSGMMQLWRMDADGGNPTRLTNDDRYNDWFPHVSPDGESLIWISFGTDVAPDQHPFYKHVTLRTMPIGGGAPRTVAYLYGGQGSINVPSWSPDGKKVAFVTNTAN